MCVRKIITFCVEKLLHFALTFLLHFASMLLHFALVLHFAAIFITFCVNITFCGDYYILRRDMVFQGNCARSQTGHIINIYICISHLLLLLLP